MHTPAPQPPHVGPATAYRRDTRLPLPAPLPLDGGGAGGEGEKHPRPLRHTPFPVGAACRRDQAPQGVSRKMHGAALIVALILLLLITIVGLSGLRTGQLEERMSANTYDRGLAFQAAEAALRFAENQIPNLRATPNAIPADLAASKYTDNGCDVSTCNANGVCARPDAQCTERWLDSSFNGWVNGPTVTSGSQSITPQYFIEVASRSTPCESNIIVQDLSGTCTTFRVTARNPVQDGRAQVLLQSTFVWPN